MTAPFFIFSWCFQEAYAFHMGPDFALVAFHHRFFYFSPLLFAAGRTGPGWSVEVWGVIGGNVGVFFLLCDVINWVVIN